MNKNQEFWDYVEKFEIVGLIETWLEEEDWNKVEKHLPQNFKWSCNFAKRFHKKGRAQGGILMGIKTGIEEVEDRQKFRGYLEERQVKLNDNIWRIITVYNNGKIKDVMEELIKIEETEEKHLIIVGDFNARIAEEGGIVKGNETEEERRQSKDKVINRGGTILQETINERGWTILNGNTTGDEEGEYTYIGPRGQTVIDFTLANVEAREEIESFEIESRIESDHQPITIKLTIEARREREREKEEKTTPVWTEEGIEEYRKNAQEISLREATAEEELDQLVKEIQGAVKTKRISNRNKKKRNSWWDWECSKKKREVKQALKRLKRNEGEKEDYIREKKEYKELRKRKKEEESREEEQEIKNIKNETEIWKYIKKEKKTRTGISESIKMEEWTQYFKKQFQGEENKTKTKLTEREEINVEQKDTEEIKREQVEKHINKLKKKKAAGEYNPQNEVWIWATENIKEKLTEIINRVWKGEGMPDRWRSGIISPIHKKGDRRRVENYRGVTLMDTAYKVYTSILEEKLREEVESKKIIPDTQAGFRRERGTMDNLYILNHTIEKELKKEKGKMFVFFADLRAAFDNVNRRKLIELMKKYGINQNLVQRIAEIYEETRAQVQVNGKKSQEFWTTKGVRQGCPLSPILFSLYTADLETTLEQGQIGGAVVGRKKFWSLAYADDLALVAKTEADLKSMMKRLLRYLNRKELELNTEKSKVMVFKKGGGSDTKEKWEWEGHKIEKVKQFKYLGYTLKRNNEETAHIEDICKRAIVAMREIWGIGERKFGGNIKRRMLLFDHCVRSILMYGAEIWGWAEQSRIERVQNRYIKWLLGLEKTTPNHIVLEEMKREKMRIEAGKRATKFEEKITNTEGKELLRECCRELRKEKSMNETLGKWEQKRKRYHERNGYSIVETERIRREGKSMWGELTTRDGEVQRQEQRNKIEESNYNPRYKTILTQGIPRYIMNEEKIKTIRLIARFRCGNEENRRRYWRTEDERKCRLCKQAEETVEHLLKECRSMRRNRMTAREVLDDTGRGKKWMKEVQSTRETRGN